MRPWTEAPSIVAEALVAVPDALLTALRPGPPASGAAVAAVLARSLSPAEYPAQPPSWLLPTQRSSFRRALEAIHRYRGAVLAHPVGSGKTFVALAVAAEVNRGSTACLVPASLLPQWQATAARLSIAVTLYSHERISRGDLPQGTSGLVIVDESHHFRNPHTKRYRHLAPWLVGRPALLLTATPIVNRVADLGHQLLLAVRDDALAAAGVISLRGLLRQGCTVPALGQLVFENEAAPDPRPRRLTLRSKPSPRECSAAASTLDRIGRLRLSRREAVAGLIRGVFLQAAGSSPAALLSSLRRYRRLLLHARDALNAGQSLDRIHLKRFTRELDDQLVWWELLPLVDTHSEIELGDLDQLDQILHEVEATTQEVDGKLSRLHSLLVDGLPSLIFTTSRATVRYLRDRLADLRIAWCTGNTAGIAATALPRPQVLGWFREPTSCSNAPLHLLVTDVAAEGLDLQRAARVIHYDLPWTPMQLEQREGRSVRYGSQHSQVEVVQFALPTLLERRLHLQATLARKRHLPAAAGLGPSGRHVWRWRAELADQFHGIVPAHGVASVKDSTSGLLAGFAFYRTGDPRPLSATVLWLDPKGGWTEAPDIIGARLNTAAAEQEVSAVNPSQLTEWLALLAGPVRERLAVARGRRWIVPDPGPGTRRAVARLQSLVRDAARRRDYKGLAELEQAVAFVTGGHTAGEADLVDRLGNATRPELEQLVGSLPKRPPEVENLEVRITALALFGPAQSPGDGVASPECRSCKPLSSISTAP